MADYPACGRDRESLIAAADAALLFAKRSGRDMVADFSEISLVELDQASLEGLSFRLEKADQETLEALAGAVAMRDAFADRSASCVTDAARRLADALGLDETEKELFATAAVVYDIGKVAIPVEVLNRRGELDAGGARDHPASPRGRAAAARERHATAQRAAGRGAPPRALGRDRLSGRAQG